MSGFFENLNNRHEQENQRYFDALPERDKELLRLIVGALKEVGFYRKDFDVQSVQLGEVLTPSSFGRPGVKISSVTEGPGCYRPTEPFAFSAEGLLVPEGQVYATVNSMQPLAGEVSTYVFEKGENNLRVVEKIVHARS